MTVDYTGLPYLVEPMRPADIHEVMRIERVSFPTPWSANAYRYELRHNSMAHYFVARPQIAPQPEGPIEVASRDDALSRPEGGWRGLVQRWLAPPELRPETSASSVEPLRQTPRPPVLGYGGFWIMAGEAHISTIAVAPEHRRRGIGELLLVTMLDRATELNAEVMTLEVRVSNVAAQSLYRKYGFQPVGRRRGYYSNNREDALIMTTERLTSATFQNDLQRLKRALRGKLTAAAMGSAT
ncbi:MAG: ribosomal protein S18-alanine N-acetyltransferase [Anaerolineae bacterium]